MPHSLLILLLICSAAPAPAPHTRHDEVLDFLADFLALQSSSIAPSYLSGVTCSWGAGAVLGVLSRRGLAGRVLDMTADGVVNSTLDPGAVGDAQAPATHPPGAPRNSLYQRTAPLQQAVAAVGLHGDQVLSLLAVMGTRGKPGRDGEPSLAEEVFVDMKCPGAHRLLQVASAMNLFRRPFRWVLLLGADCPEAPEALDPVTPRAALVDSQVTVVCGRAGEHRAVEVHRAELGGAPSAVTVVSRRGPPVAPLQLLHPNRGDVARHMQGLTLRTGIALLDSNNSINHLTDGKEKQFDQLTKTTYTMLLQAYELMNATISLHVTNSHGYIRNGKYDGLLGDLAHGLVETGGTVMLPVAFRMLAITYLGFNIPMRAVTVFRQPPLAYTDNVFWLPFPDSLWAASMVLLTICCLLAVVALYFEPESVAGDTLVGVGSADSRASLMRKMAQRRQGAGRGGYKQPLRASLSDVFLLAFGAIAQQGSPVEARGIAARLITFLLFFALLLLYTCYSASIVVLLQSSSNSIRTLRDVWKSRLDVGAENMPYNVYFIEQMAKTGDDVRRGLYHDKIARPGRPRNFMNMTEGVRRMQEGLFAFVAMDSPMYGQIQARFEEHEKCDLAEMDGYSSLRHPNIVTRRDSPITHLLKIKLLLQWERGFRHRFILRGLYSKPRCDVMGARFMSVSFIGARNAYYLIVGGMGLSVAVLLSEVLHSRLAAAGAGRVQGLRHERALAQSAERSGLHGADLGYLGSGLSLSAVDEGPLGEQEQGSPGPTCPAAATSKGRE